MLETAWIQEVAPFHVARLRNLDTLALKPALLRPRTVEVAPEAVKPQRPALNAPGQHDLPPKHGKRRPLSSPRECHSLRPCLASCLDHVLLLIVSYTQQKRGFEQDPYLHP